jgi:hypothetical protein
MTKEAMEVLDQLFVVTEERGHLHMHNSGEFGFIGGDFAIGFRSKYRRLT